MDAIATGQQGRKSKGNEEYHHEYFTSPFISIECPALLLGWLGRDYHGFS